MSRPLPRYHRTTELENDLRNIARIVNEQVAVTTVSAATLAGDSRRLRGIPVCGRGIGSTSPGTNPLAELIRRDRSAA